MSDEVPQWEEEEGLYESACESCGVVWSSPNGEGPLGWKTFDEVLDSVKENVGTRKFDNSLLYLMHSKNIEVICIDCIRNNWETYFISFYDTLLANRKTNKEYRESIDNRESE